MPKLKLHLFGAFNPLLEDEILQGFKTDKARALLAYLAAESGRPHRRSHLCNLLWPDASESRARQSLSQALYNLRQLLGDQDGQSAPYFLVHESAIQFNQASDHWVDANHFARLISAAEIHPHALLSDCPECLQRLSQAGDLYHGGFLTGFSLKGCPDFNNWVDFEAERFKRMAMHALYKLSEGLAERGELDQALAHAWRLVEMDVLWEQAQRLLIGLLAQSGRREAALAQYRACQQALRNEMGVEPELETQALYERLRDQGRQDARILHFRQNLPASLNALIGRNMELASVKRLLSDPDNRLVTVSGPGGSGKTRLATEAARHLARRFREGAYFVRLDLIDSAQFIPSAIAEALTLPLLHQVDIKDQILDYLRDREILLVLDNFDHLTGGTSFITELVKNAPYLKVMVTSRFKLGVRGEQNYSLGGLDYPEPDSNLYQAAHAGSVQFFVEASRRTFPGFELTEENYKSVIRICELAGGMPLALLLASGWVGTFSPQEIAEEMESNLDFLTANWTDVPERQRNLRATFDYSWSLLGEREQQSLAGLSVFMGSFTRQAAEQIVHISVSDLRALSEKSLLVHDASGRYEMHALLRQYAAEKLANIPDLAQDVRKRHAWYYLRMLMEWQSEIVSARKQEFLARVMLEASNLKSARKWMLEHSEPEELSEALETMRAFHRSGFFYREGQNNFLEAAQALEKRSQTPEILSIRGELHAWLAEYARLLGNPEDIQVNLAQARDLLALAANGGLDVRKGLALVWFIQGQSESALEAQREAYTNSLNFARERGDAVFTAPILLQLGATLSRMGLFEESLRCLTEGMEYYRERDDPSGVAQALTFISYNQIFRGEYALSRQTMESAAERYMQYGNMAEAGEAYRGLGLVLAWNGQFRESVDMLERSLPLLRSSINLHGLVYGITFLGLARVHLGEYPAAQASLMEVLVLARRSGYWREYSAALFGLGCIELVAGDLQRSKIYFEQSATRYRSLQYVGEPGWALGGLSLAQRASGQPEQAWRSLREGLQIIIATHSMAPTITCFLAAPLLLIDAGKVEEALEIYTYAKKIPSIRNSRWAFEVCQESIGIATSTLDLERLAAIRQRGEKLDPFAAAQKALSLLEEAFE